MIKASIDIGTNSVLLLVCEIENGRIKPLVEQQEIPRLGKGVDSEKNLHPDSQNRVIKILESYKRFLNNQYPDLDGQPVVTATSAVRDASNRNEFLQAVFNRTRWEVTLLSGDQEAEITYRGALSVLRINKDKPKPVAVLDIGGGSTEIAQGDRDDLKQNISIDMGSVRFTERFFKQNPPSAMEIEKARSEVDQLLQKADVPSSSVTAIGVAGTVTSIAAIALDLTEYNPAKLNGFELEKEKINNFIKEFSALTSEEIEKKYPIFLKGRGDVILAGVIILHQFLKRFQLDRITVSTGGIRHGILLSGKQ